MPEPSFQFRLECDPKATQHIICAQPDDGYALAVVLKQTLAIRSDGSCVPADEQEPLELDFPRYEDLEPPAIAPTCWDSDMIAFKEATDVVLQGHAYSYGKRATVDADLSFGKISRTVRVHGDRPCSWSGNGPRFGPPEPFERIPLRYDRAYGGCDLTALARLGDGIAETFGPNEPAWGLDTCTHFHYPRNRSGTGFLVEASPESIEGMRVPNLEFPDDPVTPERLAVGHWRDWMPAPLPAAFDWYDPGWFPRIAYLGEAPLHRDNPGRVREIDRGWAPADLLRLPSITRAAHHAGFLQGASPGLAVRDFKPNTTFRLTNLSPGQPERVVKLPGKTPTVKLQLTASDRKKMKAHCNAVVLRPDDDRIILVWSARCKVDRPYFPQELAEMSWVVS